MQSLIDKYKGKEFFVKFNTELLKGRNITPTEEENRKYLKAIKHIKAKCSSFSEEEGFALDHRGNILFNNCGYGGLSIASNGDVYFCNLISECAKQANIRVQPFENILKASNKARMMSDVENLLPCRDCPLKYLCGGGCRVKFFSKLVNTEINMQGQTEFTREIPCSKEYREKMYRLMVKSNSLFYQ